MSEVLHEIVTEIGAGPGTFAIEVLQFFVVVAIVYFVAFGLGKRKGMVSNMLAERRDRVAAHVERAAHADQELVRSREEASALVATAKAEAATILREARAAARSSRHSLRGAADAEAATIRERAAKVLEEERAETHVEIRDRLVGVVAQATRALLNEGLSPQEQRQLIQKIVSSQIDRLEAGAEDAPAAASQ